MPGEDELLTYSLLSINLLYFIENLLFFLFSLPREAFFESVGIFYYPPHELLLIIGLE